ncbi:MAG: hypothetical protein CL904_01815 [Dehalococcoidia bacterium]|nr:hypothetical protein [Dehalococcoidia bacterium]MQG16576.1 GNAT family N-acetyltransferase [SAR202 cluster bacterium]|tara:strand:- start:275 stop:1159 length:885 start_codon:yes stop_codon:yes gene_type:complete
MFYSYWFLTSWKQIFAPNINLIIFLFRKNEYLVGMIPVMECASGMKIAGDPELFDYQQLIIENDMEREVINSFFDYLVDEDWKQLDLSSVSGDSQKDILIEIANERSYSIKTDQVAVCPRLELPDSWDIYVSSLKKKYRHELRRKIRRIESIGKVAQTSFNNPSDAEVNHFFQLMRLTSDAKSLFLTSKVEKFFRLLIRNGSERNHVNLSFLEFNSQRIAGCLVFDYQNDFMLYNSGYDTSNRQLGAGFINKAYAIREAINLGRSSFNFLKGSERYKYELGGIDTPIHHIVIKK